jgi:cytochrome b6
MSEPIGWHQEGAQKKFQKFFPNFLYRDLLVWLIALNVLALLSVIFPDGIGAIHWPLGDKADPFGAPPMVIRPEWYFMFAFQALKMIPAHVGFIEGELFGMGIFAIGGALWALVPFLDRQAMVNKKSKLWIGFGILVVAFIVVMTALGYILE